MVISAAAPAMLASKISFILHPRGLSCTIATKTKRVIGKSGHSDDNFGSMLYRCHTPAHRRGSWRRAIDLDVRVQIELVIEVIGAFTRPVPGSRSHRS